MRARSTVLLVVIVLLAATGCRRRWDFRPAIAGEPLAIDRVVLIGTAEFDPPIQPEPAPVARDPYHRFSQVLVGFGYDPDTPIDMRRMRHGLAGSALAPPGAAFAVEAPRREMYVRTLHMYLRAVFTGRVLHGSVRERRFEWIDCGDRLRVAPGPEDRYVYIGALVCRHDGDTPLGLEAVDRFDAMQPILPALVGPVPVARRLAARVAPP